VLIDLQNHPLFSPLYYLAQNPDVASAGLEPREHYRAFGEREGRCPTPLFDYDWYQQNNPDLPSEKVNLRAYLTEGWQEGRSPHSLFFVPAYLQQRPDVRTSGTEPLTHFVEFGWREGTNPHPAFDLEFYLAQAGDLEGMDPLTHYILVGAARGLEISRHAATFMHRAFHRGGGAARDGAETPSRTALELLTLSGASLRPDMLNQALSLCALSSAPFVSVIVTNRDGVRHLPDLFESLRQQTYENFEVIFVDDGSADESADVARRFGAQVVQNQTSIGFAGANNAGLRASRGEVIALLNNDTRVDPNWLERMVAAMVQDPAVAVVAPKIRFWSKFFRLRITGSIYFQLDLAKLTDSLEYKRHFLRTGVAVKSVARASESDGVYTLVLDMPLQSAPFRLEFATADDAALSLSTGLVSSTHMTADRRLILSYAPPDSARHNAFFVINNAGSIEAGPLQPADRGFGEVDAGQLDVEQDVDLFCGCAALIRRDALNGYDLFVDEFVAYFEDSELSMRLRRRGYRIRYAPQAVVYHRHSASNKEFSLFWREHTLRNQVLFQYMCAPMPRRAALLNEAKLRLNHLRHWFTNNVEAISEAEVGLISTMPRVVGNLERIAALIDDGVVPRRSATRVGVYNAHWNTFGGGEAHAIDVAKALERHGQVELISNQDFPLHHLLQFFGHEPGRYRKRLVTNLTPALTAEYDIFVNCCYQSEVAACAPISLYVVSFPSSAPRKAFVNSYYFLANSKYTLYWMRRFWHTTALKGEVLHPAIPSEMLYPAAGAPPKEKIILCVGRFVAKGHVKNQFQIAHAFRQLSLTSPDLIQGWRLVFVGSVNDPDYLLRVASVSAGLNVELLTEVKFHQLRELYLRAFAYVHASGYGRDPEAEPQLFEHFGMAVAQAIGAGCIPIVFNAAGPKEIVEGLGIGVTFESIDDLVVQLASVLLSFPTESVNERCLVRAQAAEQRFSPVAQRYQIDAVIARFRSETQEVSQSMIELTA